MLFENLYSTLLYIISCILSTELWKVEVRPKPRPRLRKRLARSFRWPSRHHCWLSKSRQCWRRFEESLPCAKHYGKCFIPISLFLSFEQLITLPFYYHENWTSENKCFSIPCRLRRTQIWCPCSSVVLFIHPCPSSIADTICELTRNGMPIPLCALPWVVVVSSTRTIGWGPLFRGSENHCLWEIFMGICLHWYNLLTCLNPESSLSNV